MYINIIWWNDVYGRGEECLNTLPNVRFCDVIFTLETHGFFYEMSQFKYIDNNSRERSGGIVVYVREYLQQYICDVKLDKTFTSFRLLCCPGYVFVGCYIPPYVDMCHACDILPLNHMCYYNVTQPGQFTYHKAGKRSQIDYVLTNVKGLSNVS